MRIDRLSPRAEIAAPPMRPARPPMFLMAGLSLLLVLAACAPKEKKGDQHEERAESPAAEKQETPALSTQPRTAFTPIDWATVAGALGKAGAVQPGDVYRVGMSVAPVPDERLYDTIYQERYMGLPQENAAGYDTASAINHAEGLRGRLLLIHGSGDDNVHYQGSERLLNRLIALGKPVDFMEYPNRSHCICEGRGTTLHVFSLLTRYLLEHLPAGPRTRDGRGV